MTVKLLDYVKVTDENHKDFGRVGQLTDFDFVDREYVLYFDKLTSSGNVYWDVESTRVKSDQVERSYRSCLEHK